MSATSGSSLEDLPLSKEPAEAINGRLSAVPSIASNSDPNLRMADGVSFSVNETPSAIRRLGSEFDAIEGTAESLPLMASTGALSRGKSTIETLQEGGEGEDNDCLDEDFDPLDSIPQDLQQLEDFKETEEHIADLKVGGFVSESKKRKADTVIYDMNASNKAKLRQMNQYKEWSDNFRTSIPKPNVHTSDWTMVNSDFLQYARQRIEEDTEHIDEHKKKRLLYELNKAEDTPTTHEELWWASVIGCNCTVPRKLEGYEKKDCPVCKVAKRRVIQNDSDHMNTCIYCHECFFDSGREKKIVLRTECKTNHVIKAVRASF